MIRAELDAPAVGAERLMLVTGGSGSGESSLVRAGVLPRLRRRDGWVVVPPFTPQGVPLEQLCRKLEAAFADAHRTVDWKAVRDRVDGDGLASVVRDLRSAAGVVDDLGAVVVTIDQAEQLATQVASTERTAFLDLFAHALDGHAPLGVLATLRDEYPAQVLAGTALEGRGTTMFPLGRLPPDRLVDVIERPAKRAGVFFEAGLVAKMVSEASRDTPAGGDPLPLLAFVLDRLYEEREGNWITERVYADVGGVKGALEAKANRVVAQLGQRGLQDKVVVDALVQLATVESSAVVGGRTAHRSSFDDARWQVIEAFREARLVTTEGGDLAVSVSHEALLSEWSVMKSAIREREDTLVAKTRLERDAKEWAAAREDPAQLLPGAGVRAARALVAGDAVRELDPVVVRYVAASRRRMWRSRGLAAIPLAAIVLAGAGWFTFDTLRERARQRDARVPLVTTRGGPVDGHEVTYKQYRLCVAEGRCEKPQSTSGIPPFDAAAAGAPVLNAPAAAADAFCDWIGRRLPTYDELLAADRSPHVKHLLDKSTYGRMGGKEWTSTSLGTSRKVVMRDPLNGGVTSEGWVDAGQPERALGFRCIAS